MARICWGALVISFARIYTSLLRVKALITSAEIVAKAASGSAIITEEDSTDVILGPEGSG